jgi:predicted secreted protein
MARLSGRDVYISVSPVGSCPFSLSGRANTATLNLSSEEVDVTAFGALYRERIADALRDWSLEVAGFWDPAASNLDSILFEVWTACAAVAIGFNGSATGRNKYSGCMILQEYNVEAAVEGAVTFSATFQAASQMNRGTF